MNKDWELKRELILLKLDPCLLPSGELLPIINNSKGYPTSNKSLVPEKYKGTNPIYSYEMPSEEVFVRLKDVSRKAVKTAARKVR